MRIFSRKKGVIGLATVQYKMRRYEKKFLITDAQYERLLPLLSEHMRPDVYGRYEVSSLYYDTDDYAIVRSCLDHPRFKEKFRVRSYGIPGQDGIVFAEIKRKFKGVTYKRRVDLPLARLPDFLAGRYIPEGEEQITGEILWFLDRYRPVPKVFLGYDREPYEGVTDKGLRITFDRNIRWRTDHLDLAAGDCGTPLLAPGSILMEVKTPAAIPLWLTRFLSEEGIYSTGFSKYKICYTSCILPNLQSANNTNMSQRKGQSDIDGKEIYHADQSL